MSGDLAAYVHLTGHTHRHGINGPAWQEHAHLGGGAPHEHDPETGFQVPVSAYPPEIVKAVAEVLHQENCAGTSCTTVLSARHMKRARAVLEAAAPLIAAAERAKLQPAIDRVASLAAAAQAKAVEHAVAAERERIVAVIRHEAGLMDETEPSGAISASAYEDVIDLIRQPAPALRDAQGGLF